VTAIARGAVKVGHAAGPSELPLPSLPATKATLPAPATRTLRFPSATTTVPSGATATADGWTSERVTVLTCTPVRYTGCGAPAGMFSCLTCAGSALSPANLENRLATSCCTAGSHLRDEARIRESPMLAAAQICAPLGTL